MLSSPASRSIGPQFPVNLVLSGRKVLVVGGGRIAARKVGQLLAADAFVVVVAPHIVDELRHLPVHIVEREFITEDLADVWLVITATGDPRVDQAIFDEGERRKIWVNSADDPVRCSFTLPAVLRRGRLMITSSTAGASPALSSHIRGELSNSFGEEWAAIVEELSAVRDAFHAEGKSTEDVDWSPIIRETLTRYLGTARSTLSLEGVTA